MDPMEGVEGGYSETSSLSSSPTPTEDEVVKKCSNGFGSTAGNQPTEASTEVISHSFTFRDYSRAKELGEGRFLQSSIFMAGGCRWNIVFSPKSKRPKGYISLFISRMSGRSEVNARFELSLVDQSGRGMHKIYKDKQPHLIKYQGRVWGFDQFMGTKEFEKSGYLKDDCIIVNCRVEVVEIQKKLINDNFFLPPEDQISDIEAQDMKDSDFKETKLLELRSAVKTILETEFPLQDKFYQYMHAVDEIQKSIESGNISGYECQGINVIHKAMQTLGLEFQNILDCSINMVNSTDGLSSTASTTYSSSGTNSYSCELQGVGYKGAEFTSQQIDRLRNITKTMDLAGTLGGYIVVYTISRKSAVDAKLLRFGIGKWSISDFRNSDWKESTAKIKSWIRAAHTFYCSIFPWEKQYFEQIFGCFRAATYDFCFLDIVRDVAVELNKFAEAVTTTTASFQKLFDILDLYNTLFLIMPDIKAIFHTESSAAYIYLGAVRTVDGLENLVRQVLSNFEDTVLNEQLNTPLFRGIIHSLTRYAMDYITRILTYKDLLAKIIISEPIQILGISDDEQFLEVGGRNPLGLHLIRIIISLKFNLEVKSRHYEDASLAHFFLANNLHHVVEKIKWSWELLEMIGEDYSTKLSEYVLQAAKTYVGSTWDRVLDCLRDEGLNHKFPFYKGISKNALKERFKSFNSIFDEICLTQSTWLVPDSQLRAQLHKLILEKLIPAYESFLLQFRSHIESEKHPEKYIKYSSDDLQNKVHDLFSSHKGLEAEGVQYQN